MLVAACFIKITQNPSKVWSGFPWVHAKIEAHATLESCLRYLGPTDWSLVNEGNSITQFSSNFSPPSFLMFSLHGINTTYDQKTTLN